MPTLFGPGERPLLGLEFPLERTNADGSYAYAPTAASRNNSRQAARAHKGGEMLARF
jgi:hypothetical protein